MDDAGVHNSALLLLSIGEEAAAEVLKHLAPKEVQKIGEAMANMQGVTRERVVEVLDSFHDAAAAHSPIGGNADGYIRSVMTRALGDDRAGFVLDRILKGGDASGIENLKWMDAASVAEMIGNEHPQIIASILVHLDRDQASAILSQIEEKLPRPNVGPAPRPPEPSAAAFLSE